MTPLLSPDVCYWLARARHAVELVLEAEIGEAGDAALKAKNETERGWR